jgi:hypothetical protein
MKKKTLHSIAALIIIGLFGVSCVREEPDLFSESAAMRVNHSMAAVNKLLMSAENGWIMEYFPNPESAGATYIVSFISEDMAVMATKNKYVPNYAESDGHWRIINDMGPVLSFNTYNKVFHIYADPIDPATGEADGEGLKGDYEFLIGATTPDSIALSGKKHYGKTILRKLDASQDWVGYFDKLSNMNTALFGGYADTRLRLMVDNELNSTLSNGSTHVFTLVPMGGTEIDDGFTKPFIVTDYGLRLATPLKSGEKEIQSFRLSEDKNKLVSVDAGVNAEITALDPVDVFQNIINTRKLMQMNNTDDNMSASVKAEYEKINTAITSVGRTLDYVAFTNHKDKGPSLTLLSTRLSSRAEGFIGFTITPVNGTDINLKFTGTLDQGGQTFYNTYNAKELVRLLQGDFTVSILGAALTSTTLKFTSKADSSVWFNLYLR